MPLMVPNSSDRVEISLGLSLGLVLTAETCEMEKPSLSMETESERWNFES